jgi:hypothetical protein
MHWSLAVSNPRISADRPSRSRDAAHSSDRKTYLERGITLRQSMCAYLTTDSHINAQPLSRERRVHYVAVATHSDGFVTPIARAHFHLPSGCLFRTMSLVPRTLFTAPPGDST